MKIKKLDESLIAADAFSDKIEEECEMPTTYGELRVIMRKAFDAGIRYAQNDMSAK